MPTLSDQEHLRSHQYRDAANLEARIQLHKRFSTNPYGWFRWIFDHLDLAGEGRILELGCGSGALWVENLDRVQTGWSISLSDFSLGMVREARRCLASRASRFEYSCIDAQSIPFHRETFDVVLANHVLFHIPDRAKALQEIRRVLKPGGRFYATTIGPEHMIQMEALVSLIEQEAAAWTEQSRATFNLENGREELALYFPSVAVDRYEDALVITEVEPLIAYILSTTCSGVAFHGLEAKVESLARTIEAMIRSTGAITIHKDSGLFSA